MVESAQLATPRTDRRARFRKLRELLEPARDPALAIAQGLYVDRSGALNKRIAAELELKPVSTHLLIGGVGSGKTTELLRVEDNLRATEDIRPLFFDATLRHDIGKMRPGIVALQVGLELVELVQAAGLATVEGEIANAVASLRALGHGYFDDPDPAYDEDYYRAEYRPGMLEPADRLDELVRGLLPQIKTLTQALAPPNVTFVVLVDGLDRLVDMKAFQQVVLQDVHGLRSIGMGVVLAGPLRASYGQERALFDRFDQFHYQPWLDVERNLQSRTMMSVLLRRRLSVADLDDAALDTLVTYSGGVVRDLLALAQSSCVEAYVQGVDAIGLGQVELAIETFGRKHMQGLRHTEIEVLRRVRGTAEFEQRRVV